ncbi:MAG: glutathione S-transferase family protein [Pseudomonadota bacterium]
MYTVIGTPRSRAFRVIWMLEELSQDYTIDPVAPASQEAFAYHPMGKVPALKVGDHVLADSSAILAYLTDTHGAFTHPPGTLARARQDAATFHVMTEIDAALWLKAKHRFALPEKIRLGEAGEVAAFEFQRAIGVLERMMGTDPFLAGDTPTVPDFILAHCLNWAKMAKMPALLDPLERYHATLLARPAFEAARAKGEAVLTKP